MKAYIVLFLIVCFTLESCKSKTKDKQQNTMIQKSVHNLQKADATRLFDGETLSGWEITNFGPQGHVYVSGGEIILGMGDGCTGINRTDSFPTMNYEIYLEAKRVSGHDFFCGLTFPVNQDYCSLIVGGWGGVVVGLSTIDGKDGGENETTSMMEFTKETWYSIKLKVCPDKIEAWINDLQVIDFPYKGSTLGIRPEVSLSRPFGITTWKTTGAVRNIYLKE